MAEQVKRTTICELRRAGKSCPEIIRSTGYPKSTVYRIVAKFDSEGTVDRKTHKPRKDRKRTKTFLAGLKRSLKADPTKSQWLNWRKAQCDRTIRRAVNKDLGMKSYVFESTFRQFKNGNKKSQFTSRTLHIYLKGFFKKAISGYVWLV